MDDVQRTVRPRESSASSVASNASTTTTTTSSAVYDWLATYNPKVPRTLSIDLAHTIGFDGVVCCVRFSNSGKLLAISGNRVCSIFDTATGNRLFNLPHKFADEADCYIRALAFSPGDEWFATGTESNIIRVWSMEKLMAAVEESQPLPEPVKRITGHTQDVYALEFLSKDELVSGSGDETLRIWDVSSGECKRVFKLQPAESGKDAAITSLAISHSGRYVVTGALDRVVRVFDLHAAAATDGTDDAPAAIYTGHNDSIFSVCFSRDDSEIITASLDKTVRRWDSKKPGHCLQVISGHKDFVLSVTVGSGQRREYIISASKDRTVQFWDTASEALQVTLQGHKNSVISIAVNPKQAMFATGSGDGRARIWTFTEKEPTTATN